MIALVFSLLFLLYFSILDYRNGEIVTWKLAVALLVQFSIYALTGSIGLIPLVAFVYGLVFQKLGLWFKADTKVLLIAFMQHSLNPLNLALSICLCLPVYIVFYRYRFPEKNPRLVPAFFLDQSITAIIQLMSTFPTSI